MSNPQRPAPNALLIAVMGETSSGKTALAEDLADELGAQLINADSFQTYRGMDIGTAKSERKSEYQLIDIKNPDEPFGVGEWVQLVVQILKGLHKQNRSAVVVGGSGLNIRALFEGYEAMASPPDPELRSHLNERLEKEGLDSLVQELKALSPEVASKVDLKNPVRVTRALERVKNPTEIIHFQLPAFQKAKFAIQTPVEITNARILERTWEMIRNGWLEEVAMLKEAGYGPNAPGFRAHGYRELWRVLEKELGLDEAVESIVSQVRRYAKRQRSWLRTEPDLTLLRSNGETSLAVQAMAHLFAIGEGAVENGQDH